MKIYKSILCFLLVFSMIFCLSACSSSGTEMTEENVTKTVEKATIALQKFDKKALEKYVDSTTLDYIIKLSKGHKQFDELGVAIFENLTVEIKEINLEKSTVTLNINNKELYFVASSFAEKLTSEHSAFQLLGLLKDDEFLDESLATLTDAINDSDMKPESTTVTVKIKQDKKNLVLCLDEEAEDAYSGSALTAIKSIID